MTTVQHWTALQLNSSGDFLATVMNYPGHDGSALTVQKVCSLRQGWGTNLSHELHASLVFLIRMIVRFSALSTVIVKGIRFSACLANAMDADMWKIAQVCQCS